MAEDVVQQEILSVMNVHLLIDVNILRSKRLKRNKTANRLEHKASKRNLEWSENDLLESLTKYKLNSETGVGEKIFKNYLRVDNTNISAEEVAKMIKEKFDLQEENKMNEIELRFPNEKDRTIVMEYL